MNLHKISINKLFLLSSILFCFLINLYDPTWFLDSFRSVDPWVYYGTGEYFEYIKIHFSETYYFRRWTVNLNNLLVSSLFGPFYGKFFLKNIILFFSIFFLKKIIFLITNNSLVIPFIVIFFIFLLHETILNNIGTSYVQSESILLFSIYIFLILTHNYETKKLFLITLLISLLLITHQANIKWILASLSLFFFNKKFSFELNQNIIKNISSIFIWAFIFILLFDNLVQLFLGIRLDNFFIYSYETAKNVSGPFTKGYDTFYQDLFKLIFRVGYISGIILSLYLILNFKYLKNEYFKKISIFYIFLSILILLEPFHKLGYSFNRVNGWSHLLLSLIISSNLFLNLIADFKIKLVRLDKVIFFKIIKFSSKFLLLCFIFFMNFKIGNYEYNKNRNEINYSEHKKKILQTNIENKLLTKIAIKEKKRITIIDDRPHIGWSINISQLYGMYSALSLGYPPIRVNEPGDKIEPTILETRCNLIDWQLGYAPNLIIAIFTTKNISDTLTMLRDITNNCEFKGDFEYTETINKNLKLFKVKY